ncbi:MAG TPA: transcriptional regulator [Pseudonocardiaceae bacterium]|jgi:hypothetical protein|nr:transcriptional regulator [Pseudonocardiaceae bacterium]
MTLPDGWTGRSACALQKAFGLSNEAFAERLGIATRTVGSWHEKPNLRPQSAMQEILDTALTQASQAVKERFAQLVPGAAPAQSSTDIDRDAEERLSADPHISAALDWLDQHAGWASGTARRKVAAQLSQLDVRELRDQGVKRGQIEQRDIARALGDYYRGRVDGYGRYSARYGDSATQTSIVTRADWLDLDYPLVVANDRLRVTSRPADADISLDDELAEHAVRRLAGTLALDARLIDMPLYRLLDVDLGSRRISGNLGVTSFAAYALTMDLLEGELIDALAADRSSRADTLPLRDHYLPDIASVLDTSGRVCAGGTLALCAIARPADPYRGDADYLLLVQERSGHVVNAARRLAVIPKGFHQPMTDLRADAKLGATLRREMEEELFGRDDIDNTIADQRTADPMHPSRLSEPMRWLMADPSRLRMECTGFGLNLVSGNYEFPGLIVIEDDEFWPRFGGQVAANWEAISLRQYSSLDGELLTDLANDVAWSNEGLFALLQGLRRLRQIGGNRVNLPAIDWEIEQ